MPPGDVLEPLIAKEFETIERALACASAYGLLAPAKTALTTVRRMYTEAREKAVQLEALLALRRPQVCVAAVTFCDRALRSAEWKLVLGKNGAGFWQTASGHVEHGEALLAACVHEAREETGLEVTVLQSIGVFEMVDRGKVVIAYTCAATGGQLTDSDELKSVGAFTRGQTAELSLTPVTKQILQRTGWLPW